MIARISTALRSIENLRTENESDSEFLKRLLLSGTLTLDHLLKLHGVGPKGLRELIDSIGLTIGVRLKSDVKPLDETVFYSGLRKYLEGNSEVI